MFTPWGQSQTVEQCGADGVLHVTTAGHGGIFVPDTLLHRIPKDEQAYAAAWSGSRNWYEEDCAAAIPVFRLREAFARFTDAQAAEYYNGVKAYWQGRKAG
jgi:hypothetical protein